MIRKNERRKKRRAAWILGVIAALSLTACSSPFSGANGQKDPSPTRAETGFEVTGPDSYDSADTAILVDWNTSDKTLTFLNLELGRRYTLSLDGTTRFYDKYGDAIAIGQLQKGDIVDITFLKSKKHLTTLQLSPQAWTYEGAERYEINMVRNEVSIGSEVYKLTSNTQFVSEDRSIESMDLNPSDSLTFLGIGSQVLTVRVEKGHGYLRLENDENFVGGWIEVGQATIQRITDNMLVLVPEGSYQVNISHKGGGGVKSVVINRNEETVLDIGDLEIPEPQYGMVLFSLNPTSAELYIDGSLVDPSGPISLEYGLHQMIARAEGYQSITQYFRVIQESVGINVELDANETEQDKNEEKEDPEESPSGQTTENYYQVYIDAPENVEVYLDGNYMGISPCSFVKIAGTHVVTLRKTGYTTRSYTIEVDDEAKDISYSFADLVSSSATLDNSITGMWDSILGALN
ncbi:MAG: PEGA domain-containing protein [Acetatifactor sp.]|nr:PEGA domain-containing protein [Acetatifactor sp.]